jgi:predicted RNA-binding protein with PUA-like domain
MSYWLLKSEPTTFGIDKLSKSPNQTTHWEGVRNYQARNYLRAMQTGDQAFFYHSNCKVPGITGVVEIVKASYPDQTAFDPESAYYDPRSTSENPRWYRVDVKLVKIFNEIIPLELIKSQTGLDGLALIKRGNRLSVMPVSSKEWKIMMAL